MPVDLGVQSRLQMFGAAAGLVMAGLQAGLLRLQIGEHLGCCLHFAIEAPGMGHGFGLGETGHGQQLLRVLQPHLLTGRPRFQGSDRRTLAIGQFDQAIMAVRELVMGEAQAVSLSLGVMDFDQSRRQLRFRLDLGTPGGGMGGLKSGKRRLCRSDLSVAFVNGDIAPAHGDAVSSTCLHNCFRPDFDFSGMGGKSGPQDIALRNDFVHRHRHLRLDLQPRQAHRPVPVKRQEQQPEQPHDEEAEPENHRLLNQGSYPPLFALTCLRRDSTSIPA